MNRALICGISGQDGPYLARLLLDKGYHVTGTSRDAHTVSFSNLERLGLLGKVELQSMATTDFRSVLQVVSRTKPVEIYNLAGQSSVGLSFDQPVETLESHIQGTLNLLESIRFLNTGIRFYNAGSGECYGDTGGAAATETTAFKPRSPYAVAKAATYWLVSNYRDAYRLHAATGILFNHESPLRPVRFATRKIVVTACRIARGSKERLSLGATHIRRDWGWAPEYVEPMWKMLQLDTPEDFVIATGESHSLEEFTATAFAQVGLDWRDHTDTSSAQLLRPSDIAEGRGDASKAKGILGWSPVYRMKDVVGLMVEAELQNMSR
jgi:GDPmannose 4,6-dehydratase